MSCHDGDDDGDDDRKQGSQGKELEAPFQLYRKRALSVTKELHNLPLWVSLSLSPWISLVLSPTTYF